MCGEAGCSARLLVFTFHITSNIASLLRDGLIVDLIHWRKCLMNLIPIFYNSNPETLGHLTLRCLQVIFFFFPVETEKSGEWDSS